MLFLADRSYDDLKSIKDDDYKPSKHLPKEGTITNRDTNSSFEVYEQIQDLVLLCLKTQVQASM